MREVDGIIIFDPFAAIYRKHRQANRPIEVQILDAAQKFTIAPYILHRSVVDHHCVMFGDPAI
jgi:hypothetical protein